MKNIKKRGSSGGKHPSVKNKNRARSNRGEARGGFIEGRLNGNAKGFGFLTTGSGEFYIPREGMGGARHGDLVRARRIPGGDNAHITEVLDRRHNALTGTYRAGGGYPYVIPDNRRFADVAVSDCGARDGERVAVALNKDGGRVTEIFKDTDDLTIELKSVIYEFGLEEKFPRAVIKNAADASVIDPKEFDGRLDLRGENIFTIDGDDSRDFDDAVSIKKIAGGYELGVHIADVAHFVKPDSATDKEAYKRGTSVYFPYAVLPMLPESLSNGVCSLDENVDRLTLSVIMRIDASGNVTGHKITESVINSAARMTYRKTAAILSGDDELCKKYKTLVTPLKNMRALADILAKKRYARGAINFETFEPAFDIQGGKVIDVKRDERLISHYIIEEFMILANETVAEHFNKIDAPFIYRVHSAPPPDKADRLSLLLSSLGLALTANPSEGAIKSKDIQALIESADPALAPVLNRALLRAMAKAVYEPRCKGHFGLASMYYCHFTSPIRRYPDLMIHRVIKAHLRGESLKRFTGAVGSAAIQSTEREIAAEEAERKLNGILTAKYMATRIGETFAGVVSGVTERGVFVELDNTAEGFVRVETLGGQYFFDAGAMVLKGERVFRPGTEVKVVVKAVFGDRIDFELA